MFFTILLPVILVFICLILYIYYLRPEIIIQATPRIQFYVNSLQPKVCKVGNFKWSYAERGTPNRNYPSMVLVHGFSMGASRWSRLCKFLPKNQHTVIPDLPGHGGTDKIDVRDDLYSAMVEKLHEFIRLVGLENHPVHVIGLSMGGAIVTCYSATYPEHVMGTSILCPAMHTPKPSGLAEEVKQGKVSCLIDFTEDGIRRLLSMCFYTPPKVSDQIVKGILRAGRSYEDFYTKLYHALVAPNNSARTAEMAKKITSPSQVIWGENDKILHPSGAEVLKKNLPNVKEVHIIPECGHVIMIEHGIKLAALLIEFRQKHVYKHNK